MGNENAKERLMAALKAEPDYIAVGTPGGPEGWSDIQPLKAGTSRVTTVRQDGTGFTTHPDGTVVELTAEDVLESLGTASDPHRG